MTPDEYRTTIKELGLSQTAAAKLLGVNARTSRKWACGEREMPPPASRFLRYLVATGKSGASAIRLLIANTKPRTEE